MFKNCIVFKCRKCESLHVIPVYTDYEGVELAHELANLLKHECNTCGEEAEGNWVLYDVSVDP